MILLDGIQYTINTPEENCENLVNSVNDWCSRNNVRNSKDEIIQIEKNWANPLYVLAYGFSYLISICQNLIYSAGCAVNVASSSEKQLLNIADISGTKRREATKTTIAGVVYGALATDSGAVPCRITTALSYTVPTMGVNVIFHPAYDITVPVGESRTIVMIAEDYGSYSISANNDASFDENPEGFRTMYTYASVPGQDQESIAALRRRIQRKQEGGTKQDKAAEAIGQLEGVSICNVYFNESVTATETVMGIQVPPRQALLFVQGFSLKIAETYWSYMDAQLAGATEPTAVTQVYTTRAGQSLPVYIIPPTQIPVYIRLYFNQVIDDVTQQSMRDRVALLASNLTIGERLTSTQVVDAIQDNFVQQPAGCQLSLDGSDYGYQVQPGHYQVLIFSVDPEHIQIISGE